MPPRSRGSIVLSGSPSPQARSPRNSSSYEGSRTLAPRVGFEPTTLRLTAECSTIELPRNEAEPPRTAGHAERRPARVSGTPRPVKRSTVWGAWSAPDGPRAATRTSAVRACGRPPRARHRHDAERAPAPPLLQRSQRRRGIARVYEPHALGVGLGQQHGSAVAKALDPRPQPARMAAVGPALHHGQSQRQRRYATGASLELQLRLDGALAHAVRPLAMVARPGSGLGHERRVGVGLTERRAP